MLRLPFGKEAEGKAAPGLARVIDPMGQTWASRGPGTYRRESARPAHGATARGRRPHATEGEAAAHGGRARTARRLRSRPFRAFGHGCRTRATGRHARRVRGRGRRWPIRRAREPRYGGCTHNAESD